MNALQSWFAWRGRLQAVILAAVAVGLVAVANVAAHQEGPGLAGGPDPGMRQRMPFAQLNLSDDQKTQIRGIFEKHRESDQATLEQLRTARGSLRSAIYGSATPDTGKIEQLTNQIADLEAQVLKARVATEIDVASVLTDSQRQKMASMPERGPRRGPRP